MAASRTSALCGALPSLVTLKRGGATNQIKKSPMNPKINKPRRVTRTRAVAVADGGERGTNLTRREALLAVAAAAATFASPGIASAANTSPVTFDGVPNERWVNLPVSVNFPASWSPRPGQRVKQSKFMLYTDTYGPNYRYTTALPRYVDEDGAVIANSVRTQPQSTQNNNSNNDDDDDDDG